MKTPPPKFSIGNLQGAFLDEMWLACVHWDLGATTAANGRRLATENPFGKSVSWAERVSTVVRQRIDPERDRPLILLAKSGIDRQVWNPILLWHLAQEQRLLHEFLCTWLWAKFEEGAVMIGASEVTAWLSTIEKTQGRPWKPSTRTRIANGLLGICVDFGLMEGSKRRRFAPYQLPDQALLYLLHAISASQPNVRNVLDAPDWRMFRVRPEDLERELLRLHQLHRLHYDVAGSLVQLRLPDATLDSYVAGMTA